MEMKRKEVKATAELMRKKRDIEQSIKAKPSDPDAEKVRLERLMQEDANEEERQQTAARRVSVISTLLLLCHTSNL